MAPPRFPGLYVARISKHSMHPFNNGVSAMGQAWLGLWRKTGLSVLTKCPHQWKRCIKLKSSQSGRRKTRTVWCPKRHMKNVFQEGNDQPQQILLRGHVKCGLQLDHWDLATWRSLMTLTRMVSVVGMKAWLGWVPGKGGKMVEDFCHKGEHQII